MSSQFMEHRLQYIVILMTISFFIYFTAFIITQAKEQHELDIAESEEVITQEQIDEATEVLEGEATYESGGVDLLALLGAFAGFLLLQTMGIPYPLSVVMLFVIGVMLTVEIILVISIIYDFIKALPFT